MTRASFRAVFVVALCTAARHAAAQCTATGDCGACILQEDCNFLGICTDCSYCTSSGKCTTDYFASCSGDWRGSSLTCPTCKPGCPAPPPPPPPPPCELPTERSDDACHDSEACQAACGSVSCVSGSMYKAEGSIRKCDCIPNYCPALPGCELQWCSIVVNADDGKNTPAPLVAGKNGELGEGNAAQKH